MEAPSHMTEMFSRAHIAEAEVEALREQLAEIKKHLKKVIVKRYDEIVVVPSAKTHIKKLYEVSET